uniref:Reverse transcriptase domain-containing protein n=1 Tax=Tanacetum cinerariifolium TaxID=118510 RepID=A0A699J1G8_TANCI|nr:reverse transcriptase domain-containing protein [Tanacetum cinerariifolium]
MQTRSSSRLVSNQSSNPTSSTNPNPKVRNHRRSKQRIENINLEDLSPPVVTMADQRTMAQLLQAPTEGYEDAIFVTKITTDNFELKHGLLTLFFPPSKTTSLRNEITNFQQRFDESFSESWDRFKDLLRACHHHCFLELHQLDTFYNAFNSKDQDSLNFAAGASTNASTSGVSPDVAELKDMVKALLLDKKGQNQSPAPMKAVKESASTLSSETLPSNTIANSKSDLKAITTLSDLRASINLIPFFVWKRLLLLDLTPICMTLELADRSISRPVGVAKDVYVKVGSFHFPSDFVVVDFDADPRVPLILGRSFLKTGRALIDVFEDELTLRAGKEAITFNLDQTSRYSANYSDMTAKRIDVIDMACEEYSQEVLGFSDTISSGNPTPHYDPIVSATSSTLTPFENNDFLLEEVGVFLAIKDEPTSYEFHQSYLDPKGDILLLEAFLNDDPSLPPPNQRNYLPEVRKELKICEAKSDKSSVDEPPVVELKVLPSYLE